MIFCHSPLLLSPELVIGRGGSRTVYCHPGDAAKCIKILHNKERQRSVCREMRYLRRYWRQGKPFDHLTRFFGYCQTSLGRGAVFELVRSYDGTRAATLADHLGGKVAGGLTPEVIVRELVVLFHSLLDHEIIVSDPAPHNLAVCFSAPKTPRLVLIDGIGNPHFIKIADYRKVSAHRIIKKKWRYYVEDNPLLAETFQVTGYRSLTGSGTG
jgi:hypothetical protein